MRKLKITARRWPWQIYKSGWSQDIGSKYGWFNKGNLGRFGGGWNWKIGISVGGSSVHFDLIFGSIAISYCEEKKR